MDYFFTLIKYNKEAVAFIVAVSGGIGFLLNYFLARKKINEDKKSLRQQMITNNIAPMRQKWINEVRNKASEALASADHVATYRLATNSNRNDITEKLEDIFKKSSLSLDELYFYLNMALPFSRNGKQESVADAIRAHFEEINKLLNITTGWDLERYKLVRNMILCSSNHFKILFKNEWNETKSLKEIDSKKYKIEKLPPPECICSVKKK